MYKLLTLQRTRLQVAHRTYTGITWFVVDPSGARAKLCSLSPETMGLCWYKVAEFDNKSVSRHIRQKPTGLCWHMSLIRHYLHMEIIFGYKRKPFVVSRKTKTISRQPNVTQVPRSSSGHLCRKGREPWEGFPGGEAMCLSTFFLVNNS